MKLDFIPLDRLSVAKTNMRHSRKSPDISDILPTIRTRGILQTLIVRPRADAEGHFEIVAGRRRYFAALAVAGERAQVAAANDNGAPDPDPVPCAILDSGEDADAIEASIIENCARLDPDEVSRWESFAALVKQGRGLDEISLTFGMPMSQVKRILALGNLLPRIRAAYRAGDIDAQTVRHLTLASKTQQKAWLALADDPEGWAPRGHQLKQWLFGGQSIVTKVALFDLANYQGGIVADLFGEDSYFADTDSFWTAQNAAIEDMRKAYLAQGWSDVVIVGPEQHFSVWDFEKTGKRKGGRVYLCIRPHGEVQCHEGYLTKMEARRREKGEPLEGSITKTVRPEISGPMADYVALHRHAAVRAEIADRPSLALRLMAATLICEATYVKMSVEPQNTRQDATRESVETCAAEAYFDEKRRAILALLGFDAEAPTVIGGANIGGFPALAKRLIELPDRAVMEVIAILYGESLGLEDMGVETAAAEMGTDMAKWWDADEAFFALVRDREIMAELFSEIAGAEIAAANAKEKAKTQKAIALDLLRGTGGREARSPWVPRWMTFPPSAYTARGGVRSVCAHDLYLWALETARDDDAADKVEIESLDDAEATARDEPDDALVDAA